VKLGEVVSQSLSPNGGCPQGTLLGPVAFVCHINDLAIPDPAVTIKYVDDTSIIHSSSCPDDPALQNAADAISLWSTNNNMKLNAKKKTKEILINFAKKKPNIPNITIDNAIIERVLGVIISDDLTWNAHLDHIAKKANKRLYMLLRCKRAGVAKKDMLGIYLALIRPVLEYCCVVWHTTLPKYLHNFLEAIQKRAVRLICGTEPTYDECLQELNLSSL
jgi:hypothetical protein